MLKIINKVIAKYMHRFSPLKYAKRVGVNFKGGFTYMAILVGEPNRGLLHLGKMFT